MADVATNPHRLIEDLALPYASFISPIEETPYIAVGYNVMTSMRRVIERRPGFATHLEQNLTTIGGRIEDIFTWRRWNGSNFVMLAVVTPNDSRVFKYEIGVDASFIQIFTVNNTEPFSFIAQNNTCYFGNGTVGSMMQFDGKRTVSWGIAPPTFVPVGNLVSVASGITCQTDYHLRYTYWDAVNGAESSPSDVNDCITQFTNMAIQWSVFASPNPRVTHMRLYRTRDGGSTDPVQMQELTASPIANVSATVTDFTADADLQNRFAPALGANDPPPPLEGFRANNSRIYGLSGNETWYSGFDEIVNGVQEECFPGAFTRDPGGNVYAWNDQVEGLEIMAGATPGTVVFLPSAINIITGELRADLSRDPVEISYGSRGNHNTSGFGSDIAWYDICGQVRSASIGELSQDIRLEIAGLDPLWTYVKTHIAGTHRWLCFLDSLTGILRIYDIDLHKWQTPWPCGATAIHSGEISPGKRVLYAAINGQIWYSVDGKYNDAGVPYPARARTGLIPMSPLNRHVNLQAYQDSPDVPQAIDSISIERNTVAIDKVLLNLDELPTLDTAYTDISANEGDPTFRNAAKALVERRYTVDNTVGVARRISLQFDWNAVDTGFELYDINVESHAENI